MIRVSVQSDTILKARVTVPRYGFTGISSTEREEQMGLLWILVAIWLTASALLPLHMLFRALFRDDRRRATAAEREHFLQISRGF